MRSSELRGRKRIETRRIVQRFQVQTRHFLENHNILMCFSWQTSFGIIFWFIRNIAAFECFLKTVKLPWQCPLTILCCFFFTICAFLDKINFGVLFWFIRNLVRFESRFTKFRFSTSCDIKTSKLSWLCPFNHAYYFGFYMYIYWDFLKQGFPVTMLTITYYW